MKIKILPGLLFCLMMGACVTEGGTLAAGGAEATSTPVLVAVRQGNDGEAVPTESVLAMPTGPAALLPVTSTPSPESNLRSIDLSAFAEAWSSGDVKAIRAFYAPGAANVSLKRQLLSSARSLSRCLLPTLHSARASESIKG